MKIALRVDVDTLRGTRYGVPTLLKIMAKHQVKAAFFFSVGPDNMGRHLWRLLKPKFFWKMLRTPAAGLYGWDIVFMGTAWPGPKIGKRCAQVLRDCAAAGHEIGLHAWDHQSWQAKIMKMRPSQIERHLQMAYDTICEITGQAPVCSAAPGWRCSEEALLIKDKFNFKYNSDCRGDSVFTPVVDGKLLTTPQIPLSMPTYDELLGNNGVTNDNYNERLLEFAKPDAMNLLTIHAEAEGGICAEMFDNFLTLCKERNIEIILPSALLSENAPTGSIVQGEIPGREGNLAIQQKI
ncbi:MAG: 4-deoxy-4-formamido-L-arabinose-phosphoundecaprenol deformylase [Lentisphaerae bacterium]|nr:4-deoxy-4-formamido-L-arabinose-phosphoundecaprenol deformylase [Lentisphaerota bacterium]